MCDAEALVEPSWVSSAARAACLAATCSQAQVSGPCFVTQRQLLRQRLSDAARAACVAATCSQAQTSGPCFMTEAVAEPRALCSVMLRHLLSQAGLLVQLGQLAWQQPATKHKHLVHVL